MKILTRYIGLNVLQATGIVILLLIGMDVFILLIAEMDDIGKGNYGVWSAISYIVLSLPQQFYDFFPMAALIGSMLGLGQLASHRELIVMRASGATIRKIVATVMIVGILMTALITFLGEYIGPAAKQIAVTQKALQMNENKPIDTLHGTWVRENNTFINIATVESAKSLLGISFFEFDAAQHLLKASYAKSAKYLDGKWVLSEIVSTIFINEEKIETQTQKQIEWQTRLKPQLFKSAKIDPNQLPLDKLYKYIHYLKHNNQKNSSYSLSFWSRVFQPVATLIMIFLAIPFVLGSFIIGSLRTATMGLRLLIGVLIGFSFYIINEIFGPFSIVYQLPPILAALLPIVLFGGIGFALMQKIK